MLYIYKVIIILFNMESCSVNFRFKILENVFVGQYKINFSLYFSNFIYEGKVCDLILRTVFQCAMRWMVNQAQFWPCTRAVCFCIRNERVNQAHYMITTTDGIRMISRGKLSFTGVIITEMKGLIRNNTCFPTTKGIRMIKPWQITLHISTRVQYSND